MFPEKLELNFIFKGKVHPDTISISIETKNEGNESVKVWAIISD